MARPSLPRFSAKGASRCIRRLRASRSCSAGRGMVAKVMARALGAALIRLQCYEGLDATTALYEWNYQKQLLHIRLTEASDRTVEQREHEVFSEAFLLQRPVLAGVTGAIR